MDPRGRLHGFLAVLLLAIGVIAVVLWDPFRASARAGIQTLARPILRHAGGGAEDASAPTPRQKFATQAPSMEFRVQQFPADPVLLKSWCAEWQCGPSQQQLLLCLLLRELPETTAKDVSLTQKQNLFQSIHDLASEGRKSQPDNAFFQLAESLTYFYSAQETSSAIALKEALQCPRVSAGLKELNESEYALWTSERKPWMLLPVAHRDWSLQLERPFHMMSRGLALQQRSLLQKYNIEKAVELTLLHLGLAARLAEAGWTPSDQAMARAMSLRAMEPYSTQSGVDPTPAQIESNFLGFLDDQGDKIAIAKANSWISSLSSQEGTMNSRLPPWRLAQTLAMWNASTVLASLFLQAASLLLVWVTVTWFSRKTPPPSANGFTRRNVAGLAFGLSPIYWTISGWPAGGTYMLLGLFGGWLVWWGIMGISHERVSIHAVRDSVAHSLLTMLVATLLTAGAAAAALQFRQQQFQVISEHGWLR